MPVPIITTKDSWRDPAGNVWNLRFYWWEIDGRQECVGFDLRSFDGHPEDLGSAEKIPADIDGGTNEGGIAGVTSSVLRALPIGEVLRSQRKFLAESFAAISRVHPTAKVSPTARKRLSSIAEHFDTGRYDEGHFLEVARVYSEAWEAGEPPTSTVASSFGVSQSAAAKWVARARSDFGLLEPTEKRKQNGRLTERGVQMLEQRSKGMRRGQR